MSKSVSRSTVKANRKVAVAQSTAGGGGGYKSTEFGWKPKITAFRLLRRTVSLIVAPFVYISAGRLGWLVSVHRWGTSQSQTGRPLQRNESPVAPEQ